jgi:ribosomal protein L10
MNRTEKTEAVEALAQALAQSSNAILFAFAGLK